MLDRGVPLAMPFFRRHDDEVPVRHAADLATVPFPVFPQLEDQRRGAVTQQKLGGFSIYEGNRDLTNEGRESTFAVRCFQPLSVVPHLSPPAFSVPSQHCLPLP